MSRAFYEQSYKGTICLPSGRTSRAGRVKTSLSQEEADFAAWQVTQFLRNLQQAGALPDGLRHVWLETADNVAGRQHGGANFEFAKLTMHGANKDAVLFFNDRAIDGMKGHRAPVFAEPLRNLLQMNLFSGLHVFAVA